MQNIAVNAIINAIINVQNKRCECINDYIDDMSNVTGIVITSMVSDISQAPNLNKLHFNVISFRRSRIMLLLNFRAHLKLVYLRTVRYKNSQKYVWTHGSCSAIKPVI